MDHLGGYARREVFVLTVALTDDVVHELQQQAGKVPPELLIRRLAQRLRADRGLAEDVATWAVETWASALALYNPACKHSNSDEPEILTVSSSGEGEYTTIQEALQVARASDTVLVRPGTYHETLTLTSPTEIVGDGLAETIHITCDGQPCIRMQAARAIVRGLTLHTRTAPGSGQQSAVEIHTGILELTDCLIRSDIGNGITISGGATSPDIQRCSISSCKEHGIYATDHAQGTIKQCTFQHNRVGVTMIHKKSNLALHACTFEQNKIGALIHDDAQGCFLNCHFASNTIALEIRQNGNPQLRECTFGKDNSRGILVWEHGQGHIEECEIASTTLTGIEVRKGGNALIRQCKIHGGKGSGILIWEHGRGTVEQCEIFGHTLAEVEIRQDGNALLQACKIYRGKGHGVLVHTAGSGQLERCEIFEHAQAGFAIRQDGTLHLRTCTLHHMWRVGIQITENGRCTLEHCDITHNTGAATIKQGRISLQQCTVRENKGTAIGIGDGGECEIIGGSISGHNRYGIEIKQGGILTIQHADINQNGQNIFLHPGGHATRDGKELSFLSH
jgi:F-box protein 11